MFAIFDAFEAYGYRRVGAALRHRARAALTSIGSLDDRQVLVAQITIASFQE